MKQLKGNTKWTIADDCNAQCQLHFDKAKTKAARQSKRQNPSHKAANRQQPGVRRSSSCTQRGSVATNTGRMKRPRPMTDLDGDIDMDVITGFNVNPFRL